MNEIKATYSVSLRDYHMAVFYAAAMRHRTSLKILAAVGATALFCWIGSVLGIIPMFMIPAYIFLGYFIWLLFTIAVLEHGIFKYAKDPSNSLFKEMTVTFAKGSMTVETPYNGKHFSVPVDKLVGAFELSDMFLIYFDGAQLIILPNRALSGGDRAELRSLLLNTLKDRFFTRFGYNNMLPRRSPLRK